MRERVAALTGGRPIFLPAALARVMSVRNVLNRTGDHRTSKRGQQRNSPSRPLWEHCPGASRALRRFNPRIRTLAPLRPTIRQEMPPRAAMEMGAQYGLAGRGKAGNG